MREKCGYIQSTADSAQRAGGLPTLVETPPPNRKTMILRFYKARRWMVMHYPAWVVVGGTPLERLRDRFKNDNG